MLAVPFCFITRNRVLSLAYRVKSGALSPGSSIGFNLAWIVGGHPVLDAAAMGQEASKNLGLLLNQLRPVESSTLPGPVAIVLVNR